MSAVDVQAVMGRAIDDLTIDDRDDRASELIKAGATVDRLAKAAQFVLDKEWEYGEDQPAYARLNDALAAYRGEA